MRLKSLAYLKDKKDTMSSCPMGWFYDSVLVIQPSKDADFVPVEL